MQSCISRAIFYPMQSTKSTMNPYMNSENDQAQANPWLLCPSKSFPGKFSYFNGSTGETAWSLSDTDKNLKKDPIHRVTDKAHTYPEPFDPPIDDSTNTTNSSSLKNTASKVENRNDKFSKLDKNDLKFKLMAKKKKVETLVGEKAEKSTDQSKATKMRGLPPEGILLKNRVTFDLQKPAASHTSSADVQVTAQSPDPPIEEPLWYIAADTETLLSGMHSIKEFVKSDASCRLLVRHAVYSELAAIPDRGDSGVVAVSARQVLSELIAHDNIVVQSKPEYELSPEDSILQSCWSLLQEDCHVILITNNKNIRNKAKAINLVCYTLDDIHDKKDQVSQAAHVFGQAVHDKTQDVANAVHDKAYEVGSAIHDKKVQVSHAAHEFGQAVHDKTQDVSNAIHDKAHEVGSAIHDKKAKVSHSADEFGHITVEKNTDSAPNYTQTNNENNEKFNANQPKVIRNVEERLKKHADITEIKSEKPDEYEVNDLLVSESDAETECTQALLLLKIFLVKVKSTLSRTFRFINKSIQEYQEGMSLDKKADMKRKIELVRNSLLKIAERLKKIIARESGDGMTLKHLLIKGGDNVEDDVMNVVIACYKEKVTKFLEQVHELEEILQYLLYI